MTTNVRITAAGPSCSKSLVPSFKELSCLMIFLSSPFTAGTIGSAR